MEAFGRHLGGADASAPLFNIFQPISFFNRLFQSRESRLRAYRNFCGALDWFSLSVGGVGVSRGGVEFGL